MKNDPFTLTVALSSISSINVKATGELYMDDGETYAHTQGQLIWRGFTTTAASSGKTRSASKTLTLSSRDLVKPALAAGKPIVESTNTLTAPTTIGESYDPQENAFAQSIIDVVLVEKIVILGLENKPSSIKVGDKELEFNFTEGSSAENGKKESGKGASSKLVIKSPNVSIVKDWDIVVTY